MDEPEEIPESDQEDFPMEMENGHITDSNSGAEEENSSGEFSYLINNSLIAPINIDDELLNLANDIPGEYDRDIPTTHGVKD